ncbi:Omp28-related outer membrane protein, partial [candidate division KSB1 bacterium]
VNVDPYAESSPNSPAQTNINKGSWSLQFSYPVLQSYVAGTETDGNYIYLSCWSPTSYNTGYFYRYSKTGAFVDSFTITGVAGIRDLAFDGTYMYGGAAGNIIYKMNFSNQTLVSTIVCPTSVAARHICYVPDSNAFWCGDWATDMWMVNMTGNIIATIPSSTHGLTATYGSAYDTISPGGPFIYAINANSSVPTVITQINGVTGVPTGISHDCTSDICALGANGGGLWIEPGIVTGTVTLGGLIQNEKIFGYDLASTIPKAKDLTMSTMDTPNNYEMINTTVTLTGEIENSGTDNVTSFDLNYTINGGTINTMSISSVNIAYGNTYNYSHSTTWTPTVAGNYEVKIWTSNVNGVADENPQDDTITKNVTVVLAMGTKKVLIERFTGAWCQFCPDGDVVVDNILSTHGEDVVAVAVHDGDGMEFSDGIRTAFNVTGYPTANIDRTLFPTESKEPHSRGAWVDNVNSQLSSFTPCNVEVTFTYNDAARQISATVSAQFVEAAQGDMRFVFMVLEDSVTGTGSSYNQVNYYNTVSGHPYFGAGNPIIGFVHKYVLRALPAGVFGNAGVIPANVTASSNYSENFTYTIPNGYDAAQIHLVGFVAYYSTTVGMRPVLNVDGKPLFENVGISELGPEYQFINIYPNPASSYAMVNFRLFESKEVTMDVYNTIGELVHHTEMGKVPVGRYASPLNTENLESGLYIVNLTIGNDVVTKKLIIQ